MKNLHKLILEFNPTIYINGKVYDNLNDYLNNADYTNNMLHSSSYNKDKNVLSLSFISKYAMSKIDGSCGC